MREGWEWTLYRWLLLLLGVSTTAYVTVPDYPWGTPLWIVLSLDPNGWLHEVFYIWTFVIMAVFLSYEWEQRSLNVRRIRRVRSLKASKKEKKEV